LLGGALASMKKYVPQPPKKKRPRGGEEINYKLEKGGVRHVNQFGLTDYVGQGGALQRDHKAKDQPSTKKWGGLGC